MTEFVKGQWYQNQNTKQYFQCMTDAARGDNYLRLRLAGSESCFVKDHMDITVYAPASLTPDFSNAKVGDECFGSDIGISRITWVGESDVQVKYVSKSGFNQTAIFWKNNGKTYGYGASDINGIGYVDWESLHPTLFNSFAQFAAYWAEQALDMGGSCDR